MPASDPTFPLFPVLAFLGFVLSLIPLPWHLQAWNSGTCAFMLWVGSLCLVEFTNALIWADNAINVAPVWCDISSQIILGASIGIPASTLCITRRLYRITATQTVSFTRDDKRRAIYVDLGIAVGIPVLLLALHTIVQPHRFDILEEYGCSTVTYNTIPSYFLLYMWPIVLGLVSFVYSSLILRAFYVRRLQFNQILAANSSINPSRYFRLVALALIDIMCTVPLGIYTVYISLDGVPLAPWISWSDTHFHFSNVLLIPAVIWREDFRTYTSIQITRWLPIICAFLFFALFGFAEEAMKNYRRVFWFFAKRFGFHPSPQGAATGGKKSFLDGFKKFKKDSSSSDRDSLPVYVISKEVPITPSRTRNFNRDSILNADSRSTICFPDDGDVELSPYAKKFSSPSSPSTFTSPSSPSTSSCYSPRTPITPSSATATATPAYAPPSYVDSAHLDAAALELAKRQSHQSTRSWVSLPEMIIANHDEGSTRPLSTSSSFSYSAYTSHTGDEDHISISDAYLDSRATSPMQILPVPSVSAPVVPAMPDRAPTPMPIPLAAPEMVPSRLTPTSRPTLASTSSRPSPSPLMLGAALPAAPPLAYHRPFSPPSVYPVARPHAGDRRADVTESIIVTVHTQSSREEL